MTPPKGNGGSETPQPVKKESVILIKFSFVGAADFEMHQENVSPAQMLAVAGYLEWYARMQLEVQLAQQFQRSQQPKIAVPQMRM